MSAAEIATAACCAEDAFRCLARMSLHLDAVGLEVQPAVAEVIEDVGDIAAGLTHLADAIATTAAKAAHVRYSAKRRERCPA